MKILYLDESGDHSLSVIDPQYPVFVLGGVIVDADYATNQLAAAIRGFKRGTLGRDDVQLHTADIVRQRGPFDVLVDPAIRDAFHERLNALMRELDYTVIACAIRKDAHLAAWRHLRERGTSYLRPATIRERISQLSLAAKSQRIPGLELADLIVSPIGRHVAGRPAREDWAIVQSKLRRRHGSHLGAGLVILPKE